MTRSSRDQVTSSQEDQGENERRQIDRRPRRQHGARGPRRRDVSSGLGRRRRRVAVSTGVWNVVGTVVTVERRVFGVEVWTTLVTPPSQIHGLHLAGVLQSSQVHVDRVAQDDHRRRRRLNGSRHRRRRRRRQRRTTNGEGVGHRIEERFGRIEITRRSTGNIRRHRRVDYEGELVATSPLDALLDAVDESRRPEGGDARPQSPSQRIQRTRH